MEKQNTDNMLKDFEKRYEKNISNRYVIGVSSYFLYNGSGRNSKN